MSVIGLLVFILFCIIVVGLLEYVLRTAPLPAPWGTLLRLVVAIVLIIVLVSMFFGGLNSPIVIR